MSAGTPLWVDVILIAGAVVTAIYVIWTKVVHPFTKVVYMIEDSSPILLDIAREFRANGSTTLRSEIDYLREQNTELKNKNAELEEYVHTRFHDILNELSAIKAIVLLTEDEKDEFLRTRREELE